MSSPNRAAVVEFRTNFRDYRLNIIRSDFT
jgi:hypothetical protein